MRSVLCIKSLAMFSLCVLHFVSCFANPKYMNSVFAGFILSLISSIQFLMLSMHVSIDVSVFNSSSLLEALKDILPLWSLAKPLSCKSAGITSCRGKQYRLKILAPAQLPCGTLTDKSLSEL